MKPINLHPYETEWQHKEGRLWFLRPVHPKLICWYPDLGAEFRQGRFLPPHLFVKYFCPYGKKGTKLYSREWWCRHPDDPESYSKAWFRGTDFKSPPPYGKQWLTHNCQPWQKARFAWLLEEKSVVNLLDLPDEFFENCGCPEAVLDIKARRKAKLPWYASKKEWFISNWRQNNPQTWENNRACWLLKVRRIPSLHKKWVGFTGVVA